jgi:septum formation inhibitor MinC
LKDLADEGVCLWTILSTSEKTKQAAEYHGFPTTLPDPSRKPGKAQQQPTEEYGVGNIACLNRSLAEDEHYQHSGDLLMIGDIPKNAKVEVSGSLVLWGTLYGIAVVNTSADPAKSVRILKIEGGQLIVDGKEVKIPAKLRKQIGLVVSQGENGLVFSNLKPRRLL